MRIKVIQKLSQNNCTNIISHLFFIQRSHTHQVRLLLKSSTPFSTHTYIHTYKNIDHQTNILLDLRTNFSTLTQ